MDARLGNGNYREATQEDGTGMKIFKRTMGIVTVVGAFAVFAPGAFAATEFEATRLPAPCSEVEPCKTRGHGIGEERSQVLKFGAFEIKCAAKTQAKVIGEGAIAWEFNKTF